ncbi:UvrD-helicase domain-containing protein [Pelagibius marinus]|uniref:UvrD-helicase domain-containing protein n=1 Tax=Pelagibius marinus TaxID=2762760 RepID=UPI0018724862|nr:UvrD-helicase domain-containing protein [Pelagibius marinus]
MADDIDEEAAKIAASIERGSIVAAAGCGKTEQIARATQASTGCRLILTHTHAGVDALRARLKKRKVPEAKYRIDTIAGWALRFAASYPQRSAIPVAEPSGKEWNGIYQSAAALVRSGAVSRVLKASYDGLFVDEYQDCTADQHEIICALASHFPTCVFGDHLQAIFDFKGQKPVEWDKDVFPAFPKCHELTTPWRWKNAGNEGMAGWLKGVRTVLDNGANLDFSNTTPCVHWFQIPPPSKSNPIQAQRRQIITEAFRGIELDSDENLVIMADSANPKSRASLAKHFSKWGCSNIEAIDCPDLFKAAAGLEGCAGMARLEAVLEFAATCMTGVEKAPLLSSVNSHLAGGKAGAKKFADLIPLCVEITRAGGYHLVLALLTALHGRAQTRAYRREMFYSMCTALRLMGTGQLASLTDAVWQAQNRTRHRGRVLGTRNVGSTLLVKGLEFDHALVIDAQGLDRKHLYVALTRPVRSLTILSSSPQFAPKRSKSS